MPSHHGHGVFASTENNGNKDDVNNRHGEFLPGISPLGNQFKPTFWNFLCTVVRLSPKKWLYMNDLAVCVRVFCIFRCTFVVYRSALTLLCDKNVNTSFPEKVPLLHWRIYPLYSPILPLFLHIRCTWSNFHKKMAWRCLFHARKCV